MVDFYSERSNCPPPFANVGARTQMLVKTGDRLIKHLPPMKT